MFPAHDRVRRPWRLATPLVLLFLLPVPALPAGDGTSVVPAKGWRFEVFAENLPQVDNLAVAPDGSVYATLELDRRQGRVVRLRAGKVETVVDRLNRPDGLRFRQTLLIVTEEVSDGRVLEVDPANGKSRVLAELNKPEGIAVLPDGDLLVSEDTVQGRVLRVKRSGAIETVLAGLNRPEGIALGRDGALYIAETGTGRVLVWQDGQLRSVINDLDEPDQLAIGADGALWVTEDMRRGRLLKLMNGHLYVILSGLHSPQGIAWLADGSLLVAEQGRNRILRLIKEPEPRPVAEPANPESF
jgi:sugar lactone lactonase YvrE